MIIKNNSLFIIGHPRCGTTYLANLLNKNNYDISKYGKEVSFINHKDNDLFKKYLSRYFNSFNDNILDANPHNYNQFALKNINKYFLNKKLIICIRDPIDCFISMLYHYDFHRKTNLKNYFSNLDQFDLTKFNFKNIDESLHTELNSNHNFKFSLLSNSYQELIKIFIRQSSFDITIHNLNSIFKENEYFIFDLRKFNFEPKTLINDLSHFLEMPIKHDYRIVNAQPKVKIKLPIISKFISNNFSLKVVSNLKSIFYGSNKMYLFDYKNKNQSKIQYLIEQCTKANT